MSEWEELAKVGGYSADGAEKLRVAMSKTKNENEMAKHRAIFFQGAIDQADAAFSKMEAEVKNSLPKQVDPVDTEWLDADSWQCSHRGHGCPMIMCAREERCAVCHAPRPGAWRADIDVERRKTKLAVSLRNDTCGLHGYGTVNPDGACIECERAANKPEPPCGGKLPERREDTYTDRDMRLMRERDDAIFRAEKAEAEVAASLNAMTEVGTVLGATTGDKNLRDTAQRVMRNLNIATANDAAGRETIKDVHKILGTPSGENVRTAAGLAMESLRKARSELNDVKSANAELRERRESLSRDLADATTLLTRTAYEFGCACRDVPERAVEMIAERERLKSERDAADARGDHWRDRVEAAERAAKDAATRAEKAEASLAQSEEQLAVARDDCNTWQKERDAAHDDAAQLVRERDVATARAEKAESDLAAYKVAVTSRLHIDAASVLDPKVREMSFVLDRAQKAETERNMARRALAERTHELDCARDSDTQSIRLLGDSILKVKKLRALARRRRARINTLLARLREERGETVLPGPRGSKQDTIESMLLELCSNKRDAQFVRERLEGLVHAGAVEYEDLCAHGPTLVTGTTHGEVVVRWYWTDKWPVERLMDLIARLRGGK